VVIRYTENKAEPESWLHKLITRRNKNVAAVALANKNARIIWALLVKDTTYCPSHITAAVATKV
jgi:transposase